MQPPLLQEYIDKCLDSIRIETCLYIKYFRFYVGQSQIANNMQDMFLSSSEFITNDKWRMKQRLKIYLI